MLPTTDNSRIFTAFYSLFGTVLLGFTIQSICSSWITRNINSLIDRVSPSELSTVSLLPSIIIRMYSVIYRRSKTYDIFDINIFVDRLLIRSTWPCHTASSQCSSSLASPTSSRPSPGTEPRSSTSLSFP